jgi:YgiT-type zinc finger domain-containing protein
MLNKKEHPDEIVCDCCGKKGAHHKLITRSYGKGATLLVIENIPVISCPHCGETYMTAATAHKLARIKLHRKSLAVQRKVAVAAFVPA